MPVWYQMWPIIGWPGEWAVVVVSCCNLVLTADLSRCVGRLWSWVHHHVVGQHVINQWTTLWKWNGLNTERLVNYGWECVNSAWNVDSLWGELIGVVTGLAFGCYLTVDWWPTVIQVSLVRDYLGCMVRYILGAWVFMVWGFGEVSSSTHVCNGEFLYIIEVLHMHSYTIVINLSLSLSHTHTYTHTHTHTHTKVYPNGKSEKLKREPPKENPQS